MAHAYKIVTVVRIKVLQPHTSQKKIMLIKRKVSCNRADTVQFHLFEDFKHTK